MSEIFTLPSAACWFVNVFEPRLGAGENPQLQYDCMLVWPKEDRKKLAPLVKALKEAAAERFGKKTVKYALKDGDKLEEGDKLYEDLASHYFMNVTSKYKPRVVNGKREELKGDDEFYSGCLAIAAVHIYTTEHAQGGRRVSCGLDGLQRTALRPRLGGGDIDPENVFDEVEEEEPEYDLDDDDPLA